MLFFLLPSILTGRKDEQTDEASEIYQILKSIRAGDLTKTNPFIHQYRPFIYKILSQTAKRFIDQQDELSSVGIQAFHEAIQTFDLNRKTQFLSFASLVIRRRVIDYIRRERNRIETLSFDAVPKGMEATDGNFYDNQASLSQFQREIEKEYLREEIFHYQEALSQFNILFEALAEHSPKHQDARRLAIEIAQVIAEDEHLRGLLLMKKRLPTNELLARLPISRKTVERHRLYIIAVFLILIEDYQYLKSYLQLEVKKP
jgi:RNA polymerase sigma factor